MGWATARIFTAWWNLTGTPSSNLANLIALVICAILAFWVHWKFILPWVRKLVYRTGKLFEENIQKLSDEGWVLVSQSKNRASFTRDGLTLVLQVIQHQIFLSGTGTELAYTDLEDIYLQGEISNDMAEKN